MTKRKERIFDESIPDTYDYEGLKRIALKLNRPVYTLIALSPQNDPFNITTTRQAKAEWFVKIWNQFVGEGATGVHLRRLHYTLISQRTPVMRLDDMAYVNDDACWKYMTEASKDARYLDLVPMGSFVDRRNPEAVENHRDTGLPVISIESGDLEFPEEMPAPPELTLDVLEAAQRYQVEIWAEKTTMNDILMPLGEKYGIHVVTGAGELSITACNLFVERLRNDDRPVRILYVSDFDPAGLSMPVAVARKIEFMLHQAEMTDHDVQVRPVVLTPEQCEEYDLPRTPLKDRKRGDSFEERHGEGATELDALEALHPGELARILEREIERYWDFDLDDSTEDAAEPVRDQLKEITAEVHRKHSKNIASLRKEYAELVARHAIWAERAQSEWHAIQGELNAGSPDIDDFDWPEAEYGDEDDDPLFDSTRSYIDQINRYKEHQGRSIAMKVREGSGTPMTPAQKQQRYRDRKKLEAAKAKKAPARKRG